MAELPTGTVTFLFTDLEVSTRLWEQEPDAMRAALARHDATLRERVVAHGGHVVKGRGDGVHAAFETAHDAIAAAIDAQAALVAESWPVSEPLRVRMGLHTGVADLRDGDYFGSSVNRAARLMDLAHGGQVVCSQATADLARDALPEGVTLIDLGEHLLRDLSRAERVFQVNAPDLPDRFASLRSVDSFPGNLPVPVSSFVGREREMARAVEALREARVVTLTGVGGVGKTRLAYQVAAEVLPEFRDGAWLVELAAVRSSEGVVEAAATEFEVVARAGQSLEQAVVEFLGHKQLLLVLDNCEHVLDEAAALVEQVEQSCAQVRVLATSREGLAIDGERILAVPSLPAPRPDAPVAEVADAAAVQLFVQRAQERGTEFAVTVDNADAVGQVCRRLDGVPLAIELAAARVPAMNPRELAARLDHRFEVLAGGRRGKVERHQTLRATIDWSYDLLDEPERQLLARVAVFHGGWTLDAAEAVCASGPIDPGAVFALMERLVARSLVVAEDLGFQTRYRLLETIRQYGEERLAEAGETTVLQRRHTGYYVAFAGELAEQISGPDQVECGRRLGVEHENVLAALSFAIDTDDLDTAFRLVANHPGPQIQTGNPLLLPLETLLAHPGASDHLDYAYTLAVGAAQAAMRGDLELASARIEQARTRAKAPRAAPDPRLETQIQLADQLTAMAEGALERAAAATQQASELSRAYAPIGVTATLLAASALYWTYAGDADAAIPLATEGLALARQSGMPSAIVQNLAALASALAEREPDHAHALLQESVELRAKLGYETASEATAGMLVAGRVRDWPLVLELGARAIPLLHWSDYRPQLGAVFNVVARALVEPDADTAAVLQGAARRLASTVTLTTATTTPRPPSPAPGQASLGLLTAIRRETTEFLDDALGTELRRERRVQGEAMDQDHAVAYTLDAIERTRQARAE